MDIKSYIKYLYIFYNILIDILYFGTHYTGNKKAKNNKSSFKEFVITKKNNNSI